MATADMFGSTSVPPPAKAPDSGLLVTNHLNLMYILAAGLVMPPAGFGDKYYRDTLECFPGWIPLFVGKAPREAIESSVREAGHLKPSIVEVGLSRLSGRVMAVGEDGLKERRFPDQLDGSERVLLVPAPLPTSWIVSTVFRSAEDKRACESDAKDFGNVPLADFKSDMRKKTLLTKAPDTPWPPSEGPPERTSPLQAPLAAGGVMAMLLLFANLGERAVRASRVAFDPDDCTPCPADDHPILAGLGTWFREGVASLPTPADSEADRVSLQNASQTRLFWGAVERLVEWRDAGRAGSAETVLIDHLAAAAASLDPRLQAGVRKLPRHPRLPDGTRRRYRQRAVRTARYAFGARHDAVLPAQRLHGSLRLHQRPARRAGLADRRHPVRGSRWVAETTSTAPREPRAFGCGLPSHGANVPSDRRYWDSTWAKPRSGSVHSVSCSVTARLGGPARNPRRGSLPERRNGTAFIPGSTSVRVNTGSSSRADRRISICLASQRYLLKSTWIDFFELLSAARLDHKTEAKIRGELGG